MIIGIFSKQNDGFTGTIRTLTLSADAVFQPSEQSKEKSPAFRVSVNGMEAGAAWREESKAGKPYLSVQLDDPSFTSPLRCALVKTSFENTYNLVWDRPAKRRDDKGAAATGQF